MASRSTVAGENAPTPSARALDSNAGAGAMPPVASNLEGTRSGRPAFDAARTGVYAAFGASLSVVPFPWIPDRMMRRIRGALVHDIAVRRNVSLTPEARSVLAEPAGTGKAPSLLSQAMHFFGVRFAARLLARLGPVGMLWPAQTALRTYVLGRMFDRYLQTRSPGTVRMEVDEARRVRRAIEAVLVGALVARPVSFQEPMAVDDQRDAATAFIDGLLGAAAGIPERLLRRLDTAFDEALAHGHEDHRA